MSRDVISHSMSYGWRIRHFGETRRSASRELSDRRGTVVTVSPVVADVALDDLAASGKTLTNYCGFIADYIDRNLGYAKLVDASKPGSAHPRDAALRAAESRP
jgi:hypothetical protein